MNAFPENSILHLQLVKDQSDNDPDDVRGSTSVSNFTDDKKLHTK